MFRKTTLLFAASFGLMAGVQAQTANLQVIHNCPDNGAAVVDVWLNDQLLLNDFSFQDATPYIQAPAGVSFDVTITGPMAPDTTNPVFRKSFNLMSGLDYVVVASGGLAEQAPNNFDLRAFGGQVSTTTPGNVAVKVFHGAYDAPTVDVYEASIPAGTLVDDISFGEDQGYLDLGAIDYALQVRLQSLAVVAEYTAPLSGFADSSIVVLATGFVDLNGAAGTEPFGLIAVTSGGVVVPLPTQAITPAKLQVIHNCAATDAATVDVWLNDAALIDDFGFRTASAFIDAPAGVFFDVSIAGAASMDTVGALFQQTFILESGAQYVVVASGTVGSGSYSPATPFTLEVITDARIVSNDPMNVDVLVWHGATDAPTVDVVETSVPAGTIVSAISYGEAQGYLELAELDYILDVEAGGSVVASYQAPLNSLNLAGNGAIVLASGFLDPSMNNNGEAFGLWVALPSGGALVPLPLATGIEEQGVELPLGLYPVPTNGPITLQFDAPVTELVNIEVMALDGSLVYTESLGITAGPNQLNLSLGNLPSGMYMMRLNAESYTARKRFMLTH